MPSEEIPLAELEVFAMGRWASQQTFILLLLTGCNALVPPRMADLPHMNMYEMQSALETHVKQLII